ncbi:DNA-processing protein DprA [Allorhizocola rhizosphaerae]|uniref:DNA-processing protein DprA n=1 Tax=Allorhizocola rhizosphaerae TaxID=1872709 RepID=UPI000E3DF76F|nr:DNA-processing protein DprA [Allorhizocola rhizosphaerae]
MSGSDSEVLRARLLLGWLAEPGSRPMHELVAKHGPVEALARLVSGGGPKDLTAAVATRLAGQDPRRVVEHLLAQAKRLGATLLTPESPHWPVALDDLKRLDERDSCPPQALWIRGHIRLDEACQRAVAIVGARASTPYGEHVASEMAYELAERGWTVVSGGAYGIDAAAHRGALAAHGITVAVMAGGVDRLYPSGNSALLEKIAERGLLISEWPPTAAPHRVRFLTRNRVIAALTRGTVVVEAGARSGARQTLGRARKLGRRVMAVPGPVTSSMSAGCHEELRRDGDDGARLVTNAAEVLEEIGSVGDDLAPRPQGEQRAYDSLNRTELAILDATPRRPPATVAAIAAAAGVSALHASVALPSLELRGFVRVDRGGRYRLNP